MDSKLIDFINGQKLLAIATVSSANLPWIANVYFSADKDLNFYFVSADDTRHSKNILDNHEVAFSSAWFDESNLGNRKSIQRSGTCKKITSVVDISKALRIHLGKYPSWSQVINLDNILNKVIESRVYKITPNYIKFWNDELYGAENTKEFRFGE